MIFFALLLAGCVDYGFSETTDLEVPYKDPPPEDTAAAQDTGVVAEEPVYANTSDALYSVDPASGELDLIGSFMQNGQPVEYFIDIAIDMAGHMYGGTFDALYRIDAATAQVTKVCDLDADMTALTFTSQGVLVAGGDNELDRIDVGSCAAIPIVSDSPFETSGDIVGLPDGYLYWTVWGDTSDELVRVDPDNGAAAWMGVIGYEKLFGLGYHEDQLFGFSSSGEIVNISPSTARAELVSDSSVGWWGATTNPVVW